MLPILGDRVAKYYGRIEHHDYQFFLAINDISELFHKTILNEFVEATFKKKLYSNTKERKKIWRNRPNTKTMNVLIKTKSTVAEHHMKLR